MNNFTALLNIPAVSGLGQGPSSATPGSRGGRNVLLGEVGVGQSLESLMAGQETPANFSEMLRQVRDQLVADGPGGSARPPSDLLERIAGCEDLSPQEALLLIRSLGGLRRGFWKTQDAGGGNILPPGQENGKTESGEGEALSYAGGWLGLSALLRHPELADKIASSPRSARLEELVQQIQTLLERLQTPPGTPGSPGEPLAGAALLAAGNSRAANAGDILVSDPIPFSELLNPLDAASATDGKILLVSDPASREGAAIHALQDLLKPLRQSEPAAGQPVANDASPAANPFLISRSDAGPAPDAASLAVSDSRAPELESAVRKTQAAIRDMLERMEGSVRFESGARAVIQLDPPSLGRVQVHLAVDDSKAGVQAHLSADHEATREFLRENQSDLREELARQGFHPDNVEIYFDEEEPFFSPQGMTAPNAVA